jgi:hypothetical protein
MTIGTQSPAAELLFHAALLAGLGPRARTAADELASSLASEGMRTCVDAGGALLLSVAAPGGRGLRSTRRLPEAGDEPEVSRWLQSGDGPPQVVEVFGRPTARAWARAVEAAEAAGCAGELRRRAAVIGLRGRIFSVAQAPEDPARGAVCWQLDRHSAPGDVLAACGMGAAWREASALLEGLTGAPIFSRVGPWSLAWELGEAGPRLRLGTSLWARTPEGPRKGRAMAAIVSQLGGDGRFAEGLYKLLDGARAGHGRVGRAVELALCGGEVATAEFFLHVPMGAF